MTAAMIIGGTAATSLSLIYLLERVHPLLGDVASILILYTCFAGRDLARHGRQVYQALKEGDLSMARSRVGMIVGRDTDNLDEAGVSRAAVESISENIVDGVTAPLLYGIIGGPVAALTYKAINTLDSTFGYKNKRYLQFGWASARMDDLANFIPARLTAPLIVLAALILGLKAKKSWEILLRDGRKHPSPNAGLAEAAVAGALGIELGGLSTYFGKPSPKETLGDPVAPVRLEHISGANKIMWATLSLTLCVLLGVRIAILGGQ